MNIVDAFPAFAAVVTVTSALVSGASVLVQSRLQTEVADVFDVREVHVEDVTVGEVPAMRVDRTISRDFIGRWQVTIRKVENDGLANVCEAEGAWRTYVQGAKLPDDLDLEWWTEGKCAPPVHEYDPGQYFVSTTWTVSIGGGDAVVASTSNVFEVTE